jgi:hypothetical protein
VCEQAQRKHARQEEAPEVPDVKTAIDCMVHPACRKTTHLPASR